MSQSYLWGAGGVCWQRWQKKHNISVIIADNLATTQYGPGADVLPHYCCFKIMIDAILLRDLFCKTWMYYKNWKPIDISFTPNQFQHVLYWGYEWILHIFYKLCCVCLARKMFVFNFLLSLCLNTTSSLHSLACFLIDFKSDKVWNLK